MGSAWTRRRVGPTYLMPRQKPYAKGASLALFDGKWNYRGFADLQQRAYRDAMGATWLSTQRTHQEERAGDSRWLRHQTRTPITGTDYVAPSVTKEEAEPRFKWPWEGPTILSS